MPAGTDAMLRAVVAIDDEYDLALVDAGCELAREHRARLEVVVGIARPTMTCWFGPSPLVLADSLEELSASLLQRAVAGVCPDVCLTYRQVQGSARRHVLESAGDEVGTVLVLHGGTRLQRRAERRCRGSALVFVPETVAPAAPAAPAPTAPGGLSGAAPA